MGTFPLDVRRLPAGTELRGRHGRAVSRGPAVVVLLAVLAVTFVRATPAAAATFVVTTNADSGAGSLRQAITDANAAGPGNTIAFAIPGTGPFTIAPTSALPAIVAGNTTVDGCTQPGADCSALPLSLKIRLDGRPLPLAADGVTVRGLSFTNPGGGGAISFIRFFTGGQFHVPGAVTIERNYLGLAPDGTAAGNGRGLHFSGGVRTGSIVGLDGTRIVNNVIGGLTLTAIDGVGYPFGSGKPAIDLVVSGNLIGLDPTGTQPRPNGGDGIVFDVTGNLRITDNTIANNAGVGIRHRGRNQATPGSDPAVDPGTLIEGNTITGNGGGGIVIEPKTFGTDPYRGPVDVYDNTIAGNGAAGILVRSAADGIRPNLRIGGTGAGQANTIAGNDGAGVAVGGDASDTSVAVTVIGNSIHGNAGPRIDLGNDGATGNGPAGDVRTGPNSLVNFPTVVSAQQGSLVVSGTYAGAASADYRLDFYTSATPDGPQSWAGSGNLTTDADGNASFSFVLDGSPRLGDVVSATATDPDGSTSEFDTAGVTVRAAPPAAPLKLDASGFLVLGRRGDRVECRVRGAKLRTCVVTIETSGGRLVARGARRVEGPGRSPLAVRVHRTKYGQALLARHLGGVRVVARASSVVGTARARLTARARTRAILDPERFVTPAGSWVPDRAVLTPIGERFFQSLRGKIRAVRGLTCAGHTARIPWRGERAIPLSRARARVMCAHLRDLGARGPVRLVAKGHSQPIASDATEAGRRQNRRVVVTLWH